MCSELRLVTCSCVALELELGDQPGLGLGAVGTALGEALGFEQGESLGLAVGLSLGLKLGKTLGASLESRWAMRLDWCSD